MCVCAHKISMYNLGQSVKTQPKKISQIVKQGYPYNQCIPWNPQKHKKISIRHFTMGIICTTQHTQGIILKNEKQTWRACIISIILPKSIKPKHQTQQKIHKPYSTSYFQIQTKTQNPRNQGLETWNTLRKRENQYLFLKISEEMMMKNGGFVSEHSEFGRRRDGQGNEESQYAREKWKVFENCPENSPHCAKHAFCTNRMSRKQVTKLGRQKPMWQIFQCFSQLEGPLASKSQKESRSILSKTHD